MNIEEIKRRNSETRPGSIITYDNVGNAIQEWVKHYHDDTTFLLQELELVQRDNERLIISLQKLANATNDPSRVRWPEV